MAEIIPPLRLRNDACRRTVRLLPARAQARILDDRINDLPRIEALDAILRARIGRRVLFDRVDSEGHSSPEGTRAAGSRLGNFQQATGYTAPLGPAFHFVVAFLRCSARNTSEGGNSLGRER
jgi:hypothetical protein